jgi:biotin operon repressor
MTDTAPELVQFFKALADETRLKIVGLLARESYSGEQLAAILGVKPATISHHLARLAEAGLVSAQTDGHFKLYELRLDAIHLMAERLLAKDTLPQTAADLDVEAYDRKVVKDFTRRDGSLKEIPAAQKKLLAVLRHVVRAFQPGRVYSEKHVNLKLARFHADTASLRRYLISYKLMERDADGVRYWRPA